MGLTISGSEETGYSYNGKPGYKFSNRNGKPGFMLPGDDSSWVPLSGQGTGDVETGRVDPMAPLETPKTPTRDEPAPNGGSGSGTQTSPGGGRPVLNAATAAQFLQDKGLRLGAFSSIQLPGSPTNPNSGGTIEAQPFSGQEPAVTSNTLGAFSNNGVNFAALDNTGISTQDAFTNPEIGKAIKSVYPQYGKLATGPVADAFKGAFASPTQGGQQPSAGPIKPGRLADALNDTAGMQSYMSKFGSPEQDRRRAADMAFLNTEGPGSSLMGLRAKEDVLGQFHASGKTYQLNDAGTELLQSKKGGPLAMDPKAASAYRLGTMDAETYKNSYKDAVKDVTASETPVTPKQAESPFVHNPAAVNTEFRTDISAGTMAPGSAEVGGMMDAVRGIDGTPPLSSQQISDSFLNKREPLMRDPRKK